MLGLAEELVELGRLDLGRMVAVLRQQLVDIALVEETDVDLGIQLLQPSELAVLLRDQALAHRGQLEVQVEIREIEVRREHFADLAVLLVQDERPWLVLPGDAVEVQDARELALARVSEERPVH